MRHFWVTVLLLAGLCLSTGAVLATFERYGKLSPFRLFFSSVSTMIVWYGRQFKEKGLAAPRESLAVLLLTVSYAILLTVVAIALAATAITRLLS